MSGHSKWATTKRAKAVVDAKRGAIFTKMGNAITLAAREKGGDPEKNPSLRALLDKARGVNMPKDNMERAIKRGTGELAGDIVEELYYEGVLPGNIQVVIKCLTDNRNRSASLVRHALSKQGGSLGSVMWNFEQKGVIEITAEEIKSKSVNLEELELELMELNIEDFVSSEDGITVYTKSEDLQNVKAKIEEKNILFDSAELEYVAKDKQKLNEEEMSKIENFVDMLEDIEDVSDYYFNVDLQS